MFHPLRPCSLAHLGCIVRWPAALTLAGMLTVVDAGAEVTPTDSTASGRDLARSVAVTGREAFYAGDYETALALFRRAYTLFPAPTVVLYEARSLEKLGFWLEALEAYVRTTQMPVDGAPAQFSEAVAAAREEARDLRSRIPTLTLKVDGVSGHDPSLELSINGRAIGAAQLGQAQSLNPGVYQVSGSVSPDRRDESKVVLEKGQNLTVVLALAAPSLTPPPPGGSNADGSLVDYSDASSRPTPWLAYAAGGVGVAGVGTGLVTGLMATSKHSEAETACGEDRICPPGTEAVNAFRTLRLISTVSYGIGAAGIAAGVVLWLTASDGDESTQVGAIEPWGTGNTAGIRGTF